MMLISSVASVLHEGIVTAERPGLIGVEVNPMGASKLAMVESSSSVPRIKLTRSVRTSTTGGAGVPAGRMSSCETTRSSGELSRRISMNRTIADGTASASALRSYRADASERRPSFLAERAIAIGDQWATSNKTLVVVAVTSEASPPMIAAMPTAVPAPSVMTPSTTPSFDSSRSFPSRVTTCSPSAAQRTPMRSPARVSISNACEGIPSSSIT